jgi:2,5-diketo-D-gluconate reductase A
MSPDIPDLVLNNGIEVPQLGLGVYKIPAEHTRDVVLTAFDAGYRHVDTAALYRNEVGVGQAVRDSGMLRDEVFVTTKLWNDDQGYDETLRAFDASMDRLGLEVLDLYLIHWPMPGRDLFPASWQAMERLYKDGRIRAIGVSNFQPAHLRRLLDRSEVVPVVNQVELHPYLQQQAVRRTHEELGIITQAWGPLARGGDLLADPLLLRLADKHARSVAQVVLRWHVQLGSIVIPKSVTPDRIRSNAAIFDFALDDDDMAAIAELDRGHRTGADPDTFNGG